MAVRRQGSPGLGCRTALCHGSAWQRALSLAIIVSLSVSRIAHALQQEGMPVDRAAWRGALSLRTTSHYGSTPEKSAEGHAEETPDDISVQDGALGRLDRQMSRQLQEQVHFPNRTLRDPEDDYLHSIKFLERWTPGSHPLYQRNKDLHWHDMCAESLGMPKVALLFLTRGPIHMEPVWEAWLKEAEGKVLLPCTDSSSCDMREEEMQAALEACKLERSIHHSTIKRQHMFRVYTHPADPDFLGFQPGSVFQGSTVNNLLPPGEYYYRYELVEGVRSMLSAALEDRLNQRFIILCESCLPLYPPALLYMQVLHENKSRVAMDGFTETENVYSHDWQEDMYAKHGIHRLHHWKKGTQRNTLIRSHAELAAEDIRLVEAFSKDCASCQVDERFFATLLALTGKAHEAYPHAVLMFEDWTRATLGGHPHDWDPEEVHTGLLRYAREQHDCRASSDDQPLQSAEALFDSYSEETEEWPFPSSARPPFKRLTAECALLMRKFKPPTLDQAVAMHQDPLFRAWDYTGPRCDNYGCVAPE